MRKLSITAVVLLFFVSFEICHANGSSFGYQPSMDTASDKSSHPDTQQYKSSRTFGGHVLALPSYIFQGITWPVSYGLKTFEQEFPNLFKGERAPYGVYPLFELGGDAGAAYGLLAYHNKFLPVNHQVRMEVLFGSKDYNDFDLEYEIPGFVHADGNLELEGEYGNDPVKSFYISNITDDNRRTFYDKEVKMAGITYEQPAAPRLNWILEGQWKNIRIGRSEYRSSSDSTLQFSPDRIGEDSFVSVGTSMQLDRSKGKKRTVGGTRYKLGLSYTQSLLNDRYRYVTYTAEWQAFLPVRFLPENRRLAFKSRLRKAEALEGKEIPFYELPKLGSSYDLRGFPSDRFREDGSLLFTLEYRYPIWNFADVSLFMDEGQVFDGFENIQFSDFKTSYGVGLHLYGAGGFAFRSEFAFSKNHSRVILSINPNF